jgi:hypothetical protein
MRAAIRANQTADNSYQVLGDPQLDRNFRRSMATDAITSCSADAWVPRTGSLTVSGVYRFWWACDVSRSGLDADQNGRLFDLLPAGRYAGRARTRSARTMTRTGTGRHQQTDMRFGYRLRPGRRTRWS